MQEKDTVAARHPNYNLTAGVRAVFKDVCKGTLALRAGGATYLRQFPAELADSYNDRLRSSTLFNITEKTVNIMTGLVFQSEIKTGADVPAAIVPLIENIDNKGNHLNVFAREAFLKSFEGLSLILVDAPDGSSVVSLEDERRLALRPYWVRYEADDIINWQTRINAVSKSTELSLLILREITREQTGRFLVKSVTRYRVLFLNEQNQVAWELWRETKANEHSSEVDFNLEASGVIEKVSQIPAAIIYGKKQGELEGVPPLLDLALANLRHYNKQSNYDNLLALACIPVPFTKGMEQADKSQKLAFGADILMKLSENGEFGWATVDAGAFDALQKDLKDLENQMAMLGLSMLADKTASVDITATEALLNSISETAELRVMATSLKDAIELCLGYTAEYLGLGKDAGGQIELGTAWTQIQVTADVSNAPMPKADALAPEMVN